MHQIISNPRDSDENSGHKTDTDAAVIEPGVEKIGGVRVDRTLLTELDGVYGGGLSVPGEKDQVTDTSLDAEWVHQETTFGL